MRLRIPMLSALICCIQLPAQPAPTWNEATQLFAKGDYRRAVSEFETLDEKAPGNASIHFMLGKCYRQLGKAQQAQKQFDWVAKNAPNAQTRQLAQSALEELTELPMETSSGGYATVSAPAAKGQAPPQTATIAEAARMGYSPCTAGCLTAATPGWHKQHMDGYSDNEVWMDYKKEGGTQYFSQHHIGHIIKADGKSATDTGPCPVCHGTGWVKR